MYKLTLFLLSFFDHFHKRKIINFLKKRVSKIDNFIDIGAHKGESIELFTRNFIIKNVYSFEPSETNFNKLISNTNYLLKKKKINFFFYNLGLGKKKQKLNLNISIDSSSSTLNFLDKNSNYYQKKKNILGFSKKDLILNKELVKIETLDFVMKKKNFKKIDLIKIDTEGFEYDVLLGSVKLLKKTRMILFEHHFDNMIIKKYTFGKIHNFLISNNFKRIFKLKMPFRKTFEYIYANTKKI